ncbi:MAG: adenylate/guanylate cyclase domain-containing protein [Leptospira sp.]|nr:adenylate/guanylate cyclase domain-containing protein [Leptospira sp.]
MKTSDKILTITGFILIFFIIPVFSNFFALLFGNYTSTQFLPEKDLLLFNLILTSKDFWMAIINWAPFPIVSGIITFYSYPILQLVIGKHLSNERIEISKRRLINSPFLISLLGLIGWEMATSLSLIRTIYLIPDVSRQSLFLLFIVFGFWGYFVFSFSFFTVDYLNRLLLIPCFFPDGGLGKYTNTRRFSIVSKHILVWTSISLFPVLLLLFGIMNRSKLEILDLLSIFQSDILFQLAAVLLILSFMISYVLAKSMHTPLRLMEDATYRIKDQDFNTRVVIHSSDEFGVLGDAINEMTKGLAEKERIKDTFGRIVDPRIRDYLLNNEQSLGGKTVEATILFSDLRDFTKLSENRTPTQVLHILNRYFQEMSNAVETHGGFINKFIGDAILAVFGTPIPLNSPVSTALQTAYSMMENLKKLNLEFATESLPELRMGIGIHTGQVLAGNIGSLSRMEFTVIGDTVNTASRVEGLCKGLGKELLITEACYMGLLDAEKKNFTYLGEFELKGRFSKEKIYS